MPWAASRCLRQILVAVQRIFAPVFAPDQSAEAKFGLVILDEGARESGHRRPWKRTAIAGGVLLVGCVTSGGAATGTVLTMPHMPCWIAGCRGANIAPA